MSLERLNILIENKKICVVFYSHIWLYVYLCIRTREINNSYLNQSHGLMEYLGLSHCK